MKPAVTKLTALLDKPALLNWSNKLGLKGIKLDDYRNSSKSTGTNYHNEVENYLKAGIPVCEEMKKGCELFFKDIEVLACEEQIETDYFTGRLDLRFKYFGDTWIVDFKKDQRGIYLENKLQLIAYRMAKQCDHIGIVSLPDFTLIPVTIKDFKPYEEILKSLSSIYQWKEIAGEF